MASNSSHNEMSEKLFKEIDKCLKSDPYLYLKFLAYIACDDQLIEILNHILNTNRNKFVEIIRLIAIEAENNLDHQEHIKILQELWNNYIVVSADLKIETASSDLKRFANLNKHKHGAVIQYNLLRSLSKIPPESIVELINSIEKITLRSSTLTADVYNSSVSLLENAKQSQIIQVALLGVYLTYEAYQSIKDWWKGKISGKRCVKQIVDSVTSVAAGMGGGMIGGMIGASLFGPIGMVVGSFIGGIFIQISISAYN
jgi:hypothetical protein